MNNLDDEAMKREVDHAEKMQVQRTKPNKEKPHSDKR